jgi:hypothetical protein
MMSKTYKGRNESGYMSSHNYLRSNPKILITGDSFCGIFKLFRLKDAKMEVNKIKGATLKGTLLYAHTHTIHANFFFSNPFLGLTKADNANRIAFEQRFNVDNVLQYGPFYFFHSLSRRET